AQIVTITGDRISSIEPTSAPGPDRWLALPALVNAHDHGRAIRTSSIGADAKPLESWLHYLALFPSVDPYLAAAMTFANSALGGAGTVMVHYTRAQGFTDLPTEAAEVASGPRCRRPRRLCVINEGPKSAGLRPPRADPCRSPSASPCRNRAALPAH